MNNNFIIREDKLDILIAYHQNSDEIRRYFPIDNFLLDQNFLQPTNIFSGETPILTKPKKNILFNIFNTESSNDEDINEYDIDNAIKLYESMPLNRVQAFEPRLWAYLCHGPFYEFVRARYKPNLNRVNYNLENYYNEKDEVKELIKRFIENRFFTTGIRSLRRNGIASLWWAAELTHSPWERYNGIEKNNKDKFHYTKIILEQPNIYQQTFERTYGRETELVFHLLDFIHDNNLGRSEYEKLIMRLNSDLSYRIFSIQIPSDIKQNIEKLAMT